MILIKDLFYALWQQDYQMLANTSLINVIYGTLFVVILLENGFLPASILPGDSLLLLAGGLAAVGILHFFIVLLMLIAAASIGGWLAYLQGRWIGHFKIIQRWQSHLPDQYYQRAQLLFKNHGLAALIIGRFLAFIRTLIPTIAGLSGLSSGRFQLFNWLSSVLWVGSISSLGYAINLIPFFKRHQNDVMMALFILPLVLLAISLIGSCWFIWRKKRRSSHNNNSSTRP